MVRWVRFPCEALRSSPTTGFHFCGRMATWIYANTLFAPKRLRVSEIDFAPCLVPTDERKRGLKEGLNTPSSVVMRTARLVFLLKIKMLNTALGHAQPSSLI